MKSPILYSAPLKPEERESRQFWVIQESGMPGSHLGWKCPSKDYWWFPTAGFSTNQTFATKQEATKVAIRKASVELLRQEQLLKNLLTSKNHMVRKSV